MVDMVLETRLYVTKSCVKSEYEKAEARDELVCVLGIF